MGERLPQHEIIGRGDLFCLGHPGQQAIFSGYGLTMTTGRRDMLVGMLMVDRPSAADSAWVQRVTDTFGEAQLIPMTGGGERGIACQMIIDPGSVSHLHRYPGPQAPAIQSALQPLLASPPAPAFHLHWDDDAHLWRSEFARPNELLPAVRELFSQTGYGCLAVESSQGIIHVCHASDRDITGFPGCPIQAQWQLIQMPTAPLVRLVLTIYDSPDNPFRFESFLNPAEGDQLRVLSQLAGQEELILAFYGDELSHRYAATIPHDEQQWQQLDEMTQQALAYWQQLPPAQRDFDRAKAQFMQRHY